MKLPPPRYPEWLLAPLLLIPVALLQVAALNCFCALGKARVNLAWGLDAEIALLMVYHTWRGPRPRWVVVHLCAAMTLIPVCGELFPG